MSNKKPTTQVECRGAWSFIDDVSKAWLADLAVDLVRRNAGDEDLDGLALVDALIAEARPITAARGDERAVDAARKRSVRALARQEGATTHDPQEKP